MFYFIQPHFLVIAIDASTIHLSKLSARYILRGLFELQYRPVIRTFDENMKHEKSERFFLEKLKDFLQPKDLWEKDCISPPDGSEIIPRTRSLEVIVVCLTYCEYYKHVINISELFLVNAKYEKKAKCQPHRIEV